MITKYECIQDLLLLCIFRALLCYRTGGNDIGVRQLSTDHTVGNKSEASRLQSLGIDVSRLTSYGVLGSHDNTRTLGDYYLKGGYKENDILRYYCNAYSLLLVQSSEKNCQ